MPFYLILLLAFFNMTSVRAARVLVTLDALHFDASPLTIGVLAASFAFFPMLLSYTSGKVTDRFGPRWPMTFAALSGMAAMLLPALVHTLPMIFVAATLSGLSSVFYSVSLQNMVGTLSTAANRARNYSNYAMVISAANAVGPVLVGFVIDRSGYRLAFVCASLLLAVPFLLLLWRGGLLPGGQRGAVGDASDAPPDTQQRVWPVIAGSSLAQSGLDVFLVYIPVYAAGYGISASAIGLILAMTAVGGFVARLILPQLIARLGTLRLFGYALVLGALCFVVVPFVNGTLVLCIIAFVFGCGLNVSQPIALMVMYDRSPRGRSGAALGLRFAFDNATKLVGPMLFGAVAATTGMGAVFWINALLLGLGGFMAKLEKK